MDNKILGQRLEEVIKTNAMKNSDEDFLAVHVPFKKLSYVNSGIEGAVPFDISEDEFLHSHFISKTDRHNFVLVIGDSGSGKSHFIRWLKSRYSNEIEKSKEEIVIIERDENTLKSALKQIIGLNIFTEKEQEEELRKLRMADASLNLNKLEMDIIHQFAIEIQTDQDSSVLDKEKDRKGLYNFLVDEKIQEKILLKKGGPIERIRKKLVTSDKGKVEKDEQPQFKADDFSVDYELLMNLKSSSDRASDRAIRFAESLVDPQRSQQLREKTVEYLNSKIEIVVQKALKFTSQDLMEILINIRKALKRHNKGLTLFIEDITSFTGIDKGLIECLIVEHDDYDGSLCRLNSVVGITSGYYQSSLPDNIKQRATGKLQIERNSLFESENDILELGARYLNAIALDKQTLSKWAGNGADLKLLPIAEGIKEDWCSFAIGNSQTISLFPFSRRCLINLFNNLNEKTPRLFLNQVIKNIYAIYLKDSGNFLMMDKEIQSSVTIPSWKDPLYRQTVYNQGDELGKKLELFLRAWGDGTTNRTEESNRVLVGGLPEEAFKHFDLPFITGIKSKPPVKDPVPESAPTAGEGKKPVIKPSEPKESKESLKVKEMDNELSLWIAGEKLKSHRYYRDLLLDILREVIDWQTEGISYLTVYKYLNRDNIGIEDQNIDIKEANLNFDRNDSLYYALIALHNWDIQGNKKWSFPNSITHMHNILRWLEESKIKIIQYFAEKQKLIKTDIDGIDAFIKTMYWFRLYEGSIKGNETTQEMFKLIFFDEIKTDNLQKDQYHSEYWNKVRSLLSSKVGDLKEFRNTILQYMSIPLGEARFNPERAKLFLDPNMLHNKIQSLNKIKWELVDIEIIEADKIKYLDIGLSIFKTTIYDTKTKVNVISKSLEEEKSIAQLWNAKLHDSFINEASIRKTLAELRNFLKNTASDLNEHFDDNKFKLVLEDNQKAAENIGIEWKNIKDMLAGDNNEIILFSKGLLDRIKPYIEVINELDRMLDKLYTKYSSIAESKSIPDIDSKYEEVKVRLETFKNELKLVNGGDLLA